MTVLILAEHRDGQLLPAVGRAVAAARHWNAPVHLLVAGGTDAVAHEAAALDGVARVLRADAEHLAHPLAEDVASLILAVAAEYDVILAAHSSYGRNVLPRVAAKLDVAMISDVLELRPDRVYVRSIYAGNVYVTLQSRDAVQVLTVHASRFKPVGAGGSAEIVAVEAPAPFGRTRWLSAARAHSDRPDLNEAKVVVSGGRSLGSAEQFEAVLAPLAGKLGAALGATRAAVDAGYAPNEIQVGQTGVVVAPELYVAVGISGAIQHVYGMKDSRVVVAINQDPDAPIFQVADYGLVADLFEAVPALAAAIR